MASVKGQRLERVRASKQFVDGAFRNTSGAKPGVQGSALSIMREYFFEGRARAPSAPLPVHDPRATWATPIGSGLRVTWLGHSTLLIECDGVRVLTDPVFGDRASPVSFAGARRFHPAPVRIRELPELDAILLSHDHYDHLCVSSLRELARRGVPIVTSLGVGARLEALGFAPERIVELDWWEAHALPRAGMTFTATPAQHFSGRSLTDRNSTLWSSWVLSTERHRLFFSGDTGLTTEFMTIAQRLGPFDLVMLEVGAWHPAWGDIHLGPANALRALEWLGGGGALARPLGHVRSRAARLG